MRLSLDVQLDYALAAPAPLLVQLEAATNAPGQHVESAMLQMPHHAAPRRVPGATGLGERLWIAGHDRLHLGYTAQVRIERPPVVLAELAADDLIALPPGVEEYLFPSRYCQVVAFQRLAEEEFSDSTGGMRASRIVEFIARTFAYESGSSDAETTALDSYVRRAGVCRDYAHVLISLARASGIPARIASVYAPDVSPQDFHAVAELWLQGAWRLVDATGMARAEDMAVIGVGRDAADVAFLTIFGSATLTKQSVQVNRLP